MRIFRRLQSLFHTASAPILELDDPEFGRITFDLNGWVRQLEIASGTLQVYVNAETSGPSNAQRRIWRIARERMAKLDQDARQLIELQCSDELPNPDLSLREIWIHRDENHPEEEFMLVYDHKDDFDGVYRASFRSGEALYAGRDD